ncbi:hypothetical protein F4818DRAFT_454290 [Hypoxylon cercidicola]|nr:hypothetical protein F4818DRAFT_454290 [Hypoxylon cercidicola]
MVLNLAPKNGSVILTQIYLKPVEQRPDAYKPFYSLTPVFEQIGPTTLSELMASFASTDIPRWTWYTETFRPDGELLAQISNLLATAPEIAAISALQAGSLVATAQPINQNVALAGRERGGNTLGLQPVNQTWFAINVGWWESDDDALAIAAIESLHAKITDLVRHASAEFIFMNDANAKQPVIASYGEDSIRRLRAVQQVYDPHLVFQNLPMLRPMSMLPNMPPTMPPPMLDMVMPKMAMSMSVLVPTFPQPQTLPQPHQAIPETSPPQIIGQSWISLSAIRQKLMSDDPMWLTEFTRPDLEFPFDLTYQKLTLKHYLMNKTASEPPRYMLIDVMEMVGPVPAIGTTRLEHVRVLDASNRCLNYSSR